jgi:voltage-gated potassium channel
MSYLGKPEVKRLRIIRTLFLDLLLDRHARPIFIYVAFFIFITSALYHWLEGWSWLDSIYFVVITFTTIGYGDLSPTLPITKVITIFVGLNGVAILLMLFDEMRRVRAWDRDENLLEKTEADDN